MSKLTHIIDETFYPRYGANWDDAMFRGKIQGLLKPDMVILDLGAGAGIVTQMNFKGIVRKVCGVDLDPRVISNPMLDEGRIADAGGIPYPASSFDLVFADNVIEHIEDPKAVFSEVYRVLKPGGYFLFKTPNSTHYMPLIARLTPHILHQFVNSLRGRESADTFPTRYLCNTSRHVRNFAAVSGFTVEQIQLVEGRPEYLRFMVFTYLIGLAYERLVNSSQRFAGMRIVLMATLSK
jgi:ubiquinone/menaquinone biosynthesis C-methylase UbiE